MILEPKLTRASWDHQDKPHTAPCSPWRVTIQIFMTNALAVFYKFTTLFEFIVVSVEDSRHGTDLLWKKAQVQLRVALLNHATQKTC